MEVQRLHVDPDKYQKSEKNAEFFVDTGSLEPPLITIQEIGGGAAAVQDFFARPVVFNNRRGVCVTVRFIDESQVTGHTINLSLYQKGQRTDPDVCPFTG